jgi:hypothetical protein
MFARSLTLSGVAAAVAVLGVSIACGSESPTAPGPAVTPTSGPPQVTITGRVTATNGGQPLANLTVDFSGTPAGITDSDVGREGAVGRTGPRGRGGQAPAQGLRTDLPSTSSPANPDYRPSSRR